MAKGVKAVHGTIWLPLQYKLITLVTLSCTDKTNDLLSSQIDSLICLLFRIKVNDREDIQTLPFKFHPLSCLRKKPVVEIWNMIKAGMTVLA